MLTVSVSIVSFSAGTTVQQFRDTLASSGTSTLITARVVQWIITPQIADYLLASNWDFMVVLKPDDILPQAVAALCSHIFTVRIEQAEEFLDNFKERNHQDLHPSSVGLTYNLDKPLIATSTQRVELTPALLAFSESPLCPSGPVSMLNLISFRPFPAARKSYAEYIEAFKAGMGSKRGGIVKLLGETVEEGDWDELVIAQYSSLKHFVDMTCDPGYQKANQKLRLPALRDTCILMTTELELDWEVTHSERWTGAQ